MGGAQSQSGVEPPHSKKAAGAGDEVGFCFVGWSGGCDACVGGLRLRRPGSVRVHASPAITSHILPIDLIPQQGLSCSTKGCPAMKLRSVLGGHVPWNYCQRRLCRVRRQPSCQRGHHQSVLIGDGCTRPECKCHRRRYECLQRHLVPLRRDMRRGMWIALESNEYYGNLRRPCFRAF